MMTKKTSFKGIFQFSDMNRKILKMVLDAEPIFDRKKFEDWFNFKYKITDNEIEFLYTLIESHKFHLQYYNKIQLKLQFISPLLSLVNFTDNKFRAWYEHEITGTVNNYKLTGYTDFMVATGKLEPQKPFFFIQEFKKHITISNPLEQLLAEMAVAIEINRTNILRGVYNTGRFWYFVILEKTKKDKFQYYESDCFDCLKIEELKKIYIYLKAVKHKYCK